MTDPYQRVSLGEDSSGRDLVINARTEAMLDEVEHYTGIDMTIVQGSYMGDASAAASGSTHDGGGVIDIRTRDYSPEERNEVVLALREIGFAAWYRTPEEGFDPHIHAVAIGDQELDPSAAAQVVDYRNGGNGLTGDTPDDGPRVPIHVYQMGDTLGGDDAFAMATAPSITEPAKDSDHDNLTDEFEQLLGTDPHSADTDHDGLSDYVETTQTHTDALSRDTNHDGVADKAELAVGHSPGQAAISDQALAAGFGGGATLDRDHDGLSDLTEYQLGSDPTSADTDHDGAADAVEYRLGSNLNDIDSDHDGLVDSQELTMGTLHGLPAGVEPADLPETDDGDLVDHDH